jgi:two-component system cell cycle sensor histidine kinase/response regulator CckA
MTPTARKILIVDDEPPLLKMMGVYLKRMGYDAALFESSDRAWTAVQGGPGDYAGAVLDATLGGMTTQDLALKLLTANSSFCVVVASGYPVDMSTLEAAGPGRVSFVQKPFTADTLVRTLGKMLDGVDASRRMLDAEETTL